MDAKVSIKTMTKGQLISKADWHAIDSPKKQTDEFVLFVFLLFTTNKSNVSVRFWENLPKNEQKKVPHVPAVLFNTYSFKMTLHNLPKSYN